MGSHTGFFRKVLKDPSKQCLLHSDIWSNNIMFAREGVKLIDWQYITVGDPMFDLGFVIAFSINDFTTERYLSLCEAYFKEFNSKLEQLGGQAYFSDKADFERQSVEVGLRSALYWGIFWGDVTVSYAEFGERLKNLLRATEHMWNKQ